MLIGSYLNALRVHNQPGVPIGPVWFTDMARDLTSMGSISVLVFVAVVVVLYALVFLTGDLGFMALEPLRDAMGQRFINGGVAEQNIVSVAAGPATRSSRCEASTTKSWQGPL